MNNLNAANIAAQLGMELHGVESISDRIKFVTDSIRAVVQHHCPTLTTDEWCALADAGNGTAHCYDLDIADTLSSFWHGVADSYPELDDKWSVDCIKLARRLLDMPLLEQLATFEIVRHFWSDQHAGDKSFAQVFKDLGAPGLQ